MWVSKGTDRLETDYINDRCQAIITDSRDTQSQGICITGLKSWLQNLFFLDLGPHHHTPNSGCLLWKCHANAVLFTIVGCRLQRVSCPHLPIKVKEDCIPTAVIKVNIISSIYCPCLGEQVKRKPVCYLFHVLCTFQAVGPLGKVWLFMKADRQAGAGCESWSKAGWTNTPAFVAGCLRRCQTQWCGERPRKNSEPWSARTDIQTAMCIKFNQKGWTLLRSHQTKQTNPPNPFVEWNDHLSLANKAAVHNRFLI